MNGESDVQTINRKIFFSEKEILCFAGYTTNSIFIRYKISIYNFCTNYFDDYLFVKILFRLIHIYIYIYIIIYLNEVTVISHRNMENNNPKYYFKYFSFQFRLKFIVPDIRAFYGKLKGAKML